ncbi:MULTISPECIES: cation:proton antiporter [unclassified Rhizobium]|uniref:cation:proton antiporter n=1 Tax=unclassified Rhizobium TaxID=2613769 RepID=UPI000CDF55E6|nr:MULTISPECIES: cation:proton antiporter [Rhizobium]AVA20816.1 Na+/H+ antiporter subunit F [Rhizobium sp. NXC24]MDK4738961.1 cation:proton antiporter [Rhizobium sp. CNPSo 3464]UWU22029.1 cation:proton antiporter [Rhizobium tropici]
MIAASIVSAAAMVSLVILSLAFLFTVFRVVIGPTLPDRVLALDMLVAVAIGFIAVIAIKTGFTLYIDIAISLGLVGFLATVAFARFILTHSASTQAERQPLAPIAAARKPVRKNGRRKKGKR